MVDMSKVTGPFGPTGPSQISETVKEEPKKGLELINRLPNHITSAVSVKTGEFLNWANKITTTSLFFQVLKFVLSGNTLPLGRILFPFKSKTSENKQPTLSQPSQPQIQSTALRKEETQPSKPEKAKTPETSLGPRSQFIISDRGILPDQLVPSSTLRTQYQPSLEREAQPSISREAKSPSSPPTPSVESQPKQFKVSEARTEQESPSVTIPTKVPLRDRNIDQENEELYRSKRMDEPIVIQGDKKADGTQTIWVIEEGNNDYTKLEGKFERNLGYGTMQFTGKGRITRPDGTVKEIADTDRPVSVGESITFKKGDLKLTAEDNERLRQRDVKERLNAPYFKGRSNIPGLRAFHDNTWERMWVVEKGKETEGYVELHGRIRALNDEDGRRYYTAEQGTKGTITRNGISEPLEPGQKIYRSETYETDFEQQQTKLKETEKAETKESPPAPEKSEISSTKPQPPVEESTEEKTQSLPNAEEKPAEATPIKEVSSDTVSHGGEPITQNAPKPPVEKEAPKETEATPTKEVSSDTVSHGGEAIRQSVPEPPVEETSEKQ